MSVDDKSPSLTMSAVSSGFSSTLQRALSSVRNCNHDYEFRLPAHGEQDAPSISRCSLHTSAISGLSRVRTELGAQGADRSPARFIHALDQQPQHQAQLGQKAERKNHNPRVRCRRWNQECEPSHSSWSRVLSLCSQARQSNSWAQ